VEKSGKIFLATFSIFENMSKVKNHPKCENATSLGSMLWSQFSATFAKKIGEKIGIYLKKCKYHFLHNLSLFWAKNAYCFADFFGENILKIITSVPGQPDTNTGKKLALQIALST
jgi:hypothetical protein